MDSKTRFWATAIIWLFGAIAISVTSPFNPGESWASATVVLGIVLAIIASTGFVWNWGRLSAAHPDAAQGKAKRSSGDRVALLRELLDDDELEALKARLVSEMSNGHYDDGELPIAALMDEEVRG